MLKWLASVAVVTGCMNDTEGYLVRVEAVSNWDLTLGPGTPQRTTSEDCVTISPIRIGPSSDACSSACVPGDVCALLFEIDDAGDAVTAAFDDDCGSGSLSCSGDDFEHDDHVSCSFAAPNTPYCKYSGELVEVGQAVSGTVHDPEPTEIR